jgi:predicted porin
VGRFQAFSNARFDAFLGYGARTYQTFGYNSHTHNRVDKAIAYDSPNMGGFTVGFQTTSNPANPGGNEYSVIRAMYQNGPLDVQVSYEKNNNATARKDYAIGASYNFGVAKVMMLHGKEEGTKADTSIGVNVPMGAALLKAQYRTERLGTNTSGRTIAVGVDYNLSKRTALFADLSDVDGNAQNAYRVGLRHSF